MIKKEREKHRENARKYHSKVASLAGKISKMCEQHIQQLIDIDWTAMEVWDYLKNQYSPKGWSNEWDVLNRLTNTTMAECKKISVYGDQTQRIREKRKGLKTTLKNTRVITTLNTLGPEFEAYLTICLSSQTCRRKSN